MSTRTKDLPEINLAQIFDVARPHITATILAYVELGCRLKKINTLAETSPGHFQVEIVWDSDGAKVPNAGGSKSIFIGNLCIRRCAP